ncbi:UPF0488 protein CG14286-like isoform X1 [Portunus trituberculatus]|uniref:UPF0488 protein CG14286-like isoform X1 n=1 Tax=Portunus trituberculatus TaxID=210409 RepID=UPI001E1D1A04|nr:UPF0488 protein CG14286-like isoform X1 [Portunus trituberculatus]
MPPRRPQSKQKLPSKQAIQKKSPAVEEDAEAAEKFKVELQWCVQQIEAAMQKASIKEKEDMAKSHRTLTSSKASHIKKRQLMNSLFGDYRAKMVEEESKMKTEAPKLKKHSAVPEKSMFLRKSAIHSPSTTTGPPMHFQDGVEKTPPAEDPNLPDSESSSALNTKEPEHGESKGGGTSTSDSNELGNLSEGSVGDKKTASNPFRFPSQSENAFKFNFSIS